MASAKGGSGKTSLCATFATFLAQLGRRVLLIDSDFATNGLTLLYLKEVRVQAELIRAGLNSPSGLADAISGRQPTIASISEQLHLLPATFDLQAGISSPDESTSIQFQTILRDLRAKYDFILIDAQAGADDMGQIAMSRKVSDEVVIVSEYDPMSAAGVERLKALLRDDLTYERTWVLLNKILPEFAKSFSDFLEVARYLNPIPWDADVVRAYSRRKLAIDTETGNEHTIAVLTTLKGLCGESIEADLESWAQSRAAMIRQPLQDQYDDAEKEMRSLLSRRRLLERHRTRLRILIVMMLLSFFMVILVNMRILYSSASQLLIAKIFPFAFVFAFALSTIFLTTEGFFDKVLDTLLRFFDVGGIDRQLTELRFDRQLDLLRDRLKKLEVLRTLDPEALLRQPSLRRDSIVNASLLDGGELVRNHDSN
jgi:cellulose biosynthesis protein BcsQ